MDFLFLFLGFGCSARRFALGWVVVLGICARSASVVRACVCAEAQRECGGGCKEEGSV